MSQNVENKVVEFQFNNSNFEKNVSKSMSTLEKLKNALNFDGALKGFDNLDRATRNFDMSSMEKSVGGMSDKFSALQTIAVGALIKIGEQAIVAGEQVAKALTIDQIAAGFDKYTNKVQSVATMYATGKYDMEEIEGSLSNLNTYTDKTSYSFSTLVDNMAKFTSAGVELQDAEKAMEGIGNWAALSGITAASGKVNQMAYNLSQAVGSGALLLQDWKSIENVNAATEEFKQTLIDTGLEFGTLTKEGDRVVVAGTDIEVTVNNLRNTLQKRWVNDKVLLSVLGQYADETTELGQRAQKAAAEARTLEDAVGAVSDAISTSWMATHETLFGDYKQATLFFTGLQDYFLDIFDSMNTARNELLSGALSNDTSWGQLQEMFETLSGGEKTFEEQMKDMAKRYGYSVDEMIAKYGSMKNAMEAGEITGMTVSSAFGYYAKEILKAAAATDVGTDSMTDYEKAVIRFANGGYGKGMDAMRAVTEEGWDYDQMVQDAARHVNDAKFGLDNYSEAQLNAIGFTKDQVRGLMTLSEQAKISGTDMNDLANAASRKSGRTLLVDSLYNSLEALRKVLGTVKKAWQNIFPQFTAEKLYSLIEQFEKFTRKLTMNEETADKLRRTFEGLFAIVDVLGTFISDVFVVGLDLVKSLLGETDLDVLEFTGSIGDNAVALRDWIKKYDPFKKALEGLSEVIKTVIGFVGGLIDKIKEMPIVGEAFAWIEEKATNAKDAFIKWAESTEPIQNGLGWIGEKAGTAFGAIKEGIQKILEIPEVAAFIETVGSTFEKVFSAIEEFFSSDKSELIDNYKASLSDLNKIDLTSFKEKAVDIISKFIGNITDFLTSISLIKDTTTSVLGHFSGSIEEVKTTVGPIFKTIGGWIKAFITEVGELWEILKNVLVENPGSIVALLTASGLIFVISKFLDIVEKFAISTQRLVDSVSGVFTGLKTAFEGFGAKQKLDGIANVINAIGNALKNVAVMALGIGVLAAIAPENLDKALLAVVSLIAIVGAMTALNTAMSRIGKGGGSTSYNKSLNVNVANGAINSMIQMAGTVLILAEALKKLSDVPDPNKLWNALGVLSIVVVEMTAVSIVLGRLGKKINLGGISLLAFAGTIYILAAALEKFTVLEQLEGSNITESLLSITAIIALVGALLAVARGTNIGSALTILAIGAVVMAIANMMDEVANVNWKQLLVTAGLIIAVVTAIGVVGRVMSKTNAGFSSALNVVAIGASMLMLAEAIKKLQDVDLPTIALAALAFATFIAEFIAAIWLIGKTGGGSAGAAVTITALGLSIIAVAGALHIIAAVPIDGIWRAVGVVGALLLSVSALVASTRGASSQMRTLLSIAGILAVLMAGVAALSMVKQGNLITATAAVDTLLLCVAGIILAARGFGNTNPIAKTFTAVGLVLAEIGAIILIANKVGVDATRALAVAGSISIMLLSMAASIKILSKVEKIDGSAYAALGVMSALVIVLATVVSNLTDMKSSISSALTVSASVGVMLVAMAAAVKILSGTKTISKGAYLALLEMAGIAALLGVVVTNLKEMSISQGLAVALSLGLLVNALAIAVDLLSLTPGPGLMADLGIAVLTGVVWGLSKIIIDLKDMDPDTAIGVAKALSLLVASMSACMILLTIVGAGGPLALAGAVSLALVVGGMLLLVVELGKLNEKKPEIQEFVESGISLLNLLFTGLAEIFANIIVTYMETVAAALPGIGADLSTFAENASVFIEKIQGVNADVLEGTLRMAKVIVIIGASEVVNALVNAGTHSDSIGAFASQLTTLGRGMAGFARLTNGVTLDEKVVNAVDTLANVALKLGVASVLDAISMLAGFKPTTFESFAKSIEPLGAGIRAFNDCLKNGEGDIDSEGMMEAAKAADILGGIAQKMSRHWGVIDIFIGKQMTLDEFGKMLPAFGEKLKDFSYEVEDIKDLTPALTAASQLGDLAERMPMEGGIISWFKGVKKDLKDFGKEISNFGWYLYNFSLNASEIKDVSAALTAANKLQDLAERLPVNSGFWPWLKGIKNDLGDFGESINKFAAGLTSFSETSEGVNLSAIEKTVTVSDMLVDISEKVGGNGDGAILGIYAIGDSLEELGVHLSAYYAYISGFSMLKFKTVTDAVTELATAFSIAGDVSSNIDAFGASIESFSVSGLDEFLSGFEGSEDKIHTSISGLFEKYIQAINENKDTVVTAFKDIMAEAVLTLNDYIDQFSVEGQTHAKQYATGAESQNKEIVDSYVDPVEDSLFKLDDLDTVFSSTGLGNAESLISGYGSKSSDITSAIDIPVDQAIQDLIAKHPEFANVANGIGLNIASGVDSSAPAVDASTSELSNIVDFNLSDLGKDGMSEFLTNVGGMPALIEEMGPEYQGAFEELFGYTETAVSEGTYNVGRMLENMSTDALQKVRSQHPYWFGAGEYLAKGLENGIWNGRYGVYETVEILSLNALERMRMSVDERSPSKATEEIGLFLDLGLVNGINKGSGDVMDSVWDVGTSALDRMRDALSNATDENIDVNPVITPVLDLSEIQNGAGLMSSMLQDDQYQMMGSMRFASAASSSMSGKVDLTQQAIDRLQLAINKLSGQQGVTNNNTFNIESNDPEAVAYAVSDILQHNVERTNAQWA